MKLSLCCKRLQHIICWHHIFSSVKVSFNQQGGHAMKIEVANQNSRYVPTANSYGNAATTEIIRVPAQA
jgi:hypothetical protein